MHTASTTTLVGAISRHLPYLLIILISSLTGSYTHAQQCSWEFVRTTLDIKCNLRAIEPLVPLDLQVAETANRLEIQCSADLLHASELPAGAFARLQKLSELQVDACKMQRIAANTFDGLMSLKRLSVQTHNSVWGPGKSLEILASSFAGLRELNELNLSDNNIRQLPEGVWCTMQNLQVLNLTVNRIRSAENLGFSEKMCTLNGASGGAELQVLDVSHNELRALPDVWGASRLRRLQQLNLQHNNISTFASNALAGLSSLRILNLSYNHLETLPADAFAGNKELREIHLQGNELYDLPKGLLHRLEQLLVLDLSANQLTSHHIDNNTFAGLIRLIVLNLSNNALTRVGAKTFKELYFLQILDMRNNSIGHIEDGAFLPLYNLHTLKLSENRLHTLDNKIFNGLFVLNKLTLNNNLISIVETQAFRNCSDLKELDLSSNQLADVPEAVQDLTMLKTLDLGENQISDFKNGTFKNLSQLTGLRLIDNRIGNITVGMFTDLPRLTVLNLAKNRIQSIERGSFAKNSEIEAIRLDKNFLTDINGIFATLATLLWLNLSENHLVWFDYAFIPSNLKWLDIHGNYIEALGNYYKLQEEIRVTTLDASHNRITEIGAMSVPNSIELLFINNNIINQIQANTFVDKTRLARVDLYANVLSKITLNSLRVAPVATDKPVPEFYLGGNPFECDCSMEWLQRINNLTTRQHPRIVDLGNIECLMPHSRNAPIRQLTALSSSDFVCKYDSHCPATCHCCDFEQCDCEMVCPDNCTCFHDATWSTNIVDCGKQNRINLPARIPTDVTDLYLDGNNLPVLDAQVFAGKRNLRALYLNASNVMSVQNGSFDELNMVRILHLENNKLQTLEGHEFRQLSLLRELYLHNNLLTHISNTTFAPLVSLKVLRLDNNRMTAMPIAQLANLQYRNNLQGLTIGRNAWSCRCQFLQELAQFVADNAIVIRDAQDIYCVDAGVKRELDLITSNGVDCSELLESASNMASQDISGGYVPLLAAVLVLIFLIVVLIIVFVFRESVRVWLFAHYGVRVCEPRFEDAGKLYDAIILHSAKDYEFVCRNIAAELEHGRPPFRLCIQQRDLPPEASHLQIVEAARASRKIILVLTRNLLSTEWNRLEFRNAFHEALRGLAQKLVIIEETNVSSEAEEVPELAPYLKSVPSNRLLTCDRYFWEKLRYAIPIELSPRGNNYTLDHHERFKQPVSPGMIFRQAPPPPAYYQEDMEANYSSATTATPSPRPSRHGARIVDAIPMRPPSEHIYHSIESEYSAYDPQEALSMIPNGGSAATFMQHHAHQSHHPLQHPQQQQLLAPNSYRVHHHAQTNPRASTVGHQAMVMQLQQQQQQQQQWRPSMCLTQNASAPSSANLMSGATTTATTLAMPTATNQQQSAGTAPVHLRTGSNLSQASTSTQSTSAAAQTPQPQASTSAAAAAAAAAKADNGSGTATTETLGSSSAANKNNGQAFLV
ncbi:toll-like receptor 7 [Bactrocera neohumeralis]|uniref:toll-like receptor 7 n=1 Tax=Bactrocera neohumeralis TaxID=98809 RepID=UPI0021662C2A|nr:toll-like receptor 7 [Bactrocera neohumeralis]